MTEFDGITVRRDMPTGDQRRTMDHRVFYVLVCLRCSPGMDPEDWVVMPFGSPAERGEWAAAHTAGTGHDQWVVLDQVVPSRCNRCKGTRLTLPEGPNMTQRDCPECT